jgi:hypothetical protein
MISLFGDTKYRRAVVRALFYLDELLLDGRIGNSYVTHNFCGSVGQHLHR